MSTSRKFGPGFHGVTIMVGLNLFILLLINMTSRQQVQSAALSTIRPNLFVNFSAPHQKIVKVSVKLSSETGMVSQGHHPLALLHNYNSGGRRLMLNSYEDSGKEEADPMMSSGENSAKVMPRHNTGGEEEDDHKSDESPIIIDFTRPDDVISSEEHHEHVETKDHKENSNIWIPPLVSQEKMYDDLDNYTQETRPEAQPFMDQSNEYPDYYSGNDSENTADIYDDHSRYFVKVKATKPRDALLGLGLSSNPIPQSIEPQFLITSPETAPLIPLSFKVANPQEPPKFEGGDYADSNDKSATVPNYININSRDVEDNTGKDSSASPGMPNLIVDLNQNYGQSDSTSIPGMPGIDYPILGEIPVTAFDCQKQRYKGFFADVETNCQSWHFCDFSDNRSTFLCPNGTLFSQVLLTCDWWFNVDCKLAQQLYVINERLYRYIKAPKPSFPEDFHGPHVDSWLKEQLDLGLLPKMKKIVKDKVVIQDNN